MNSNFRAVLLTILTISVFTIAIIELSGISQTALINKFGRKQEPEHTEASAPQQPTRSQQVAQMPKTTIEFYEKAFNFGKQTEGAVLKHTFRFKNTGANPLMIAKADVSCGCTVPKFPEGPIAPGAEGEMTVSFNTAGKSGYQKKNIIVHSNAQLEAMSISIEADLK